MATAQELDGDQGRMLVGTWSKLLFWVAGKSISSLDGTPCCEPSGKVFATTLHLGGLFLLHFLCSIWQCALEM